MPGKEGKGLEDCSLERFAALVSLPGVMNFRALLLLSFCWVSCADKPEEEESSPTAPKLIGRVASVHEKEGFVLIEGYGEFTPGSGLLVTTRGEGRSATLVVTGERSSRYAAADIKGGEVKVGDAAYGRPRKEDLPTTPEPTPKPPENASPEAEKSKKADDQEDLEGSNRDGSG
ncbi:MAG: hypothetical protein MUF31_04935 [Akkermansiaceae bacterium]|nr:hypothetical protein [Akkermansiaceae bacterium]